ncbi:hypothetical protein GW17_00056426 [Ensete ventricosum]|nr:hypothetical protein GW17_00056426 [Ensete ventricosum]RZR79259.1 hypothetical protein BHM03_00004930 [Ensete ventricosum]
MAVSAMGGLFFKEMGIDRTPPTASQANHPWQQQSVHVGGQYRLAIQMADVTRLCYTKSIITVNGQYPGPTILARDGDRVVVNVVNHVRYNVTIHWYGSLALCYCRRIGNNSLSPDTYYTILRTTFCAQAWSPATAQRLGGRAGVREWWNADTEVVISQALENGGEPNISDAFTINGLPGDLYNCSAKDTFKLMVRPGESYLLRLINAALNDELFFSIANHTVTVVEVDAAYVKPFEADTMLISAGQTMNVLLQAKPNYPNATFSMRARPYATGSGNFDNTTVAAILEYQNPSSSSSAGFSTQLPLYIPVLPAFNDTSFAADFTGRLRSLATAEYPANVPQTVDRRFFFTVGLGTDPCPRNQTCQGPNGTKFSSTVNNISFAVPTTALLQAHFFWQWEGVFTPEFPAFPLMPFNFTGTPPNNTYVSHGTELVVLPFNTSVELVMQDTSILGTESHPLHLHGYNFFVVGEGSGNFDPASDPAEFNLVDPVERNTVGVPDGGWVAIRFLADNPGVWFMHCHIEIHLSWGLTMAWLVLDGALPDQKLPPPPSDLPKC